MFADVSMKTYAHAIVGSSMVDNSFGHTTSFLKKPVITDYLIDL